MVVEVVAADCREGDGLGLAASQVELRFTGVGIMRRVNPKRNGVILSIIIDECQRVTDSSYSVARAYRTVTDNNPVVAVCGLAGTRQLAINLVNGLVVDEFCLLILDTHVAVEIIDDDQ